MKTLYEKKHIESHLYKEIQGLEKGLQKKYVILNNVKELTVYQDCLNTFNL